MKGYNRRPIADLNSEAGLKHDNSLKWLVWGIIIAGIIIFLL